MIQIPPGGAAAEVQPVIVTVSVLILVLWCTLFVCLCVFFLLQTNNHGFNAQLSSSPTQYAHLAPVFAVRRGWEDLLQEHPQQHQVQHQAVRQEDPRGGGQDGVSPSRHITRAALERRRHLRNPARARGPRGSRWTPRPRPRPRGCDSNMSDTRNVCPLSSLTCLSMRL